MPKIVWGPFVGDYAANGTDIYAQGTLPIGVSTIYPASMPGQVSPLTAARSPVLQEISVGMSGEEAAGHTVSGVPPLSLPDSLGYPLMSWSVDLVPKQDLHGYDSPWPAGGGKNKLPLLTNTSVNSITLTLNANGYYDASGTATSTASFSFPEITLPSGEYVLNGLPEQGQLNISFRYGLTINGTNTFKYEVENTFTLAEESTVQVHLQFFNGYNATGKAFKPMICLASTGTTFAPYSNICPINGTDKLNMFVEDSYDPSATPKAVITLPNTVYTGTVGSEGGESRFAEVDLGTLNYTYASDINRFYSIETIPNIVYVASNADIPTFMCESYKAVSFITFASDSQLSGVISQPAANTRINIRNTQFTDEALFKASLSGVKLIYELTTPTQFAVTSPTIPTPRGTANAWATAEDGTVDSMSVTYVGKP